MKKKDYLFIHFLLPYLFIFLIIILTFIAYSFCMKNIQVNDTTTSLCEYIHHNTVSSFVNMINNSQKIQIQLSKNNVLSQEQIDPLTSLNKKNEMIKIATAYDASIISLYQPNSKFIYSSQYVGPVSSFCESVYTYSNLNSKELLELLQSPKDTIQFYPEQLMYHYNIPKEKCILVTLPYRNGQLNHKIQKGKILISFSCSNLLDYSLNIMNKNINNCETLILSDANKILIKNSNLELSNSEIDFLTRCKAGTNTIIHNNEKWVFCKSDLRYIQCITLVKISSPFLAKPNNSTILFLLIIIFFIIAIIIYKTVCYSYKPIQELINIDATEKVKTIGDIHKIISQLSQTKLHYEKLRLENEEKIFIEDILCQLSNQASPLPTSISYSKFATYSILVIKVKNLSHKEAYSKIKSFLHGVKNYLYIPPDNNNSNIILVIASNKNVNELKTEIKKLFKMLTELYQQVSIGVGNFTDRLYQLKEEYLHAISCLNLTFTYNFYKVIFFDELVEKDEYDTEYVMNQINNLKNYILTSNSSMLQKSLEEIKQYIKGIGLSYKAYTHFSCDFINSINKMLESIVPSNPIPHFIDLTELVFSNNIDCLFDAILLNIIEFLNLILLDHKENSNDKLISEIKSYIKENCCSSQFSLQEVSNYFNLSLPAMCQLFKDNTGQTIFNYATSVKIKLAQDFLINSTISVNDLSIKLGYSTPSGFIRRFKQMVSITPADYRNLHSKQQ